MEGSRSTGARLGRAAALLWRQRQRAQQAPVAPAAASLGRAAGSAVGKLAARHQAAHGQTPGVVSMALRRGGRQLWVRCANVFSHLGLQVSAVLFLFFAGGFGIAGVKGWIAGHAHKGMQVSASVPAISSSTALELGLALLFAYFGISSWFRAAARKS